MNDQHPELSRRESLALRPPVLIGQFDKLIKSKFRWGFFLSACAILLLATLFFLPARIRHSSVSALSFSTERFDLGEGEPGQELHGTLELRSSARESIEFTVNAASCGCTRLDPAHGTVEAGGKKLIKVSVRMPSAFNSERVIRIVARALPMGEVSAECLVLAQCPAPLQVSPPLVNFGSITKNDCARTQQIITIRDRFGKQLPKTTKFAFDSSSRNFQIERLDPKSQECRLKVSIAPTIPNGTTSGAIRLHMEGLETILEVPIAVTLEDYVTAIPSTVFLVSDVHTGQYKDVAILIRSHDPNRPVGMVVGVNAPPGVSCNDETPGPPSRFRKVRLRLSKNCRLNDAAQMTIRCEGMEDEITLKLVPPSTKKLAAQGTHHAFP